jgi:DNA modification methylase
MAKLLHGDCLELMKSIPNKSIDMILCDLPYGTTACKWDVVIPFEPLWKEYKRIIKDRGCIALFGSEPFSSHLRMSNIKDYKYDLYWVKEKPVNFFQLKRRFGKLTENICIFYDKQPTYNAQKEKHLGKKVTNRPSENAKFKNEIIGLSNSTMKPYNDDGTRFPCDILKFRREVLGTTMHPTQKPVALLEYLVKTYTLENETVLDNCMGSGSTGVACINTNRNFIGIEKDETYFKIAEKRIDEAQEKKKELLFS